MSVRHWVLAAALLGSAGLVLFSEPVAPPTVSEAVARPESAPAVVEPAIPGQGTVAAAPSRILKLEDRAHLMGARPGQRSAALFQAHSWAPAPAVGAVESRPQAPPLPFAYVGQQTQGAELVVFLASGDTTYVVRTGDELEGKYRVASIAPSTLTLVYLPLQETQILPLE